MSVSQTVAVSIDAEPLRAVAALLFDMGASEVFLFGSAARNELRPKSDIDIAVRGLPPARFFAAASKAADVLGRPVDLMDLDDPTPTVRYILGSGELVRVL
jgi:predicted nucleotidyltransferase